MEPNYSLWLTLNYKSYLCIRPFLLSYNVLKKVLILVLLFCSFCDGIFAQDVHFTQWMHAPHTYSPSSIGDFDGEYRFHGNYRNQWSSVTVPFVTFASMVESNVGFKNIKNLAFSGGVIYDVTGDSKFSTTHINLGSGYKLPFIPDSLGNIRLGIQPTITQKKIDLDALKFDNQYNGFFYDGNLSNGEILPRLSRWYFDFAIGIQYDLQLTESLKLRTAFSGYNLLSPKQSFFNNNDIRLDRRLSWQIDGEYKLNEKLLLKPGVQFSKQGDYYALNFGSLICYDMSKSEYFKQAFFAGVYFRTVDSGDLIVGMDYDRWKVGVSYDINYSGLVPASNYRGGVELAVIYIIPVPNRRPKYKVCPDY